ncbi:Retrotransposon gag domain [Arabidopsis suecica]|uniref:Retrotransposon gag domain n=1 Tax=Arabidopsis suecica TaxID=45249 RepID=A0A8T1XKA2_ARASU|nr:Retrotransposon gag domain [Arabidopsis suecica]
MDDFDESVDRHQQGVDRHHTGNMPMTFADYNRPDPVYSNRSAIRPPPPTRADFTFKPWYNDLVSKNQFDGLEGQFPFDHIEKFEDMVSSIKAEGVPPDYLLCKLFPYSLGERRTIWLRQLRPGSLTTWQEVKDAFLIHFYDESMSEEVRLQISSFSQGPTESFKAAWLRFGSYQRNCPHHGFNKIRLLGIFFKGIDYHCQVILDGASNGNFTTRTPSEATSLIENSASSYSIRGIDNKRRQLAAKVDSKKLEQSDIHSVSTSCQSIQHPAHSTTSTPPSTCNIEAMLEEIFTRISALNSKVNNISTQLNNTTSSNAYVCAVQLRSGLQQTISEMPLMTACHAVLMESEADLVDVTESEDDFVVAEAVSTDTNWCRPTPVQKSEKLRCDEAKSTWFNTDCEDNSTHSLSVDRHHLGVDRHSSGTEAESTFDEAESSELDTAESTPDSSFNRHSPSVDRHWTCTAPIRLEFPPVAEQVYTPQVPYKLSPSLQRALILYAAPQEKIDKKKTLVVSEQVSGIIKSRMPEKLPDPGSFVLDCSISTVRFPRSLCDLGFCINLIPHSVALRLGMTAYMPTKITLLLADRSKRIPEGVLEDVPMQIGECLIPTDFVVLENEEEPTDPLILGRSSLATAGAQIDVKQGRISLHVCDMVMTFDMDKLKKPPTIDGQVFSVETSTDITARYVKELDSVEQVTLKAAKLEDWSGDYLFNARFQDEVQISDKLLQDDVFLMESRIAEIDCRTSAEIRAADLVSIDTTMVSVDTRLDEMDHCRPHHLVVDTRSRHSAPVSVDTTYVGRHPGRVESKLSVKAVFRAEIMAASPGTVATAPLPLHPPPKQLRYSRSPPKPPDFIDKTLKFSKTVLRLSKPRVSRRALVSSFDDCAGKRSIPPIHESRPADVTYFHGQPHALTA